jgi:hypothetical protein
MVVKLCPSYQLKNTRLAVFEIRLQREIILPKGNGVTSYWEILHSEELLLISKHYLDD